MTIENISVRAALAAAMTLAGAATFVSCGDAPSGGAGYAVVTGDATGCIQGIATNALTGLRVTLGADTKIYTVFNNTVYEAVQFLADGLEDAKKAEFAGNYQLCGVPNANMALPLYVKVTGYQPRIYSVTVASAIPNRNTGTAEPGYWVTPTVIQNVEIFKLSDLVQKDYSVVVTNRGAAVADAAVWLKQRGLPTGMPSLSVSAQTDIAGKAVFAAATLAFGADYTLVVFPKSPIAADGSFLPPSTSTDLTLGTTTATSAAAGLIATDPLTLRYDLGAATAFGSTAPRILTTTFGNTVVTNGALVMVFDRDVAVDVASLRASATSAVTVISTGTKTDGVACVAADIGTPVLDATRSITAVAAGTSVTLTPNWTTAPTLTACSSVKIRYAITGVKFYSKGTTVPVSVSPAAAVDLFLNGPAVQ